MCPLQIEVKVGNGGFPENILKKSGQLGPEIFKRTNQMLSTIEKRVQFHIPRGQHCPGEGKGGTTKSAIRHRTTSQGGEIFADEGIAPWWKIFVDGRGPVVAGGKGASRTYQGKYIGKSVKKAGKRAPVLHFCIKGKHIFRRSVGPAQGNDVMRKGALDSEAEINRQALELGQWLERIGG